MIRIGADFSGARKGMEGATQQLGKFRRDTERTTATISGRRGLGGISTSLKGLGNSVTSSLSQIQSSKGIGGIVSSLRSMAPVIGQASTGLRGLGGSAITASRAFGIAGVAIGVFIGALSLATVGVYKASQTAVKFEADLGRVNMALKGGTREYLQWARAQKLAKSTSVELGATYGTLLSSFISDNRQLQNETKNIVHATRVTASATGRTIEDTLERMRSGLLGNTEAIEDLGIFVNVSMIESTKAFKQFANGKSWDQLDFRVQQQIRLAAILEQTYARYGNTLQQNVMTKQTTLTEQLKDIKLNLSQAFLPIWDAVLPPLIKLAEVLGDITESIARFMYWLRGWDYDEQTQGTNTQTDAVVEQGDAYKDLGKQAKKARGELAAFDRLNLIGDSAGGSGGGIGGKGGDIGSGGWGGTGSGGSGTELPPFPAIPKLQFKFDMPSPPDAGMGAVATAVTATLNSMIAETKARMQQWWNELQLQTSIGALNLQISWDELWSGMGLTTAAAVPTIQGQVSSFYSTIQQTSATATTRVGLDWKSMLSGMLATLIAQSPQIGLNWELLKSKVLSMQNPLLAVRDDWKSTLSFMQNQLNAYRPYIEWGWHLVAVSVRNLTNPLADIKTAWASTLENMYTVAAQKMSGIVDKVNTAINAWDRLKQTLTGSGLTPVTGGAGAAGAVAGQKTPTTSGEVYGPQPFIGPLPAAQSSKEMGRDIPVIGQYLSAMDWLQSQTSWISNLAPYAAGGPSGAIGAIGSGVKGGSAAAGWAAKLLDDFTNMLKGVPLPQFASGAVVSGPTLAIVGDNHGASVDPEVIAPLSKLEDIMNNGSDAEEIGLLRGILQAVRENRNVKAIISRDEVGRASVDYINDESRRGKNPLPAK